MLSQEQKMTNGQAGQIVTRYKEEISAIVAKQFRSLPKALKANEQYMKEWWARVNFTANLNLPIYAKDTSPKRTLKNSASRLVFLTARDLGIPQELFQFVGQIYPFAHPYRV